tara:strand:+ start:1022 stop:1234 length:213 start_codon:yes stop_codon:yes gene_type:complete
MHNNKITCQNIALKLSEIDLEKSKLDKELRELKVNEEIIKFNIDKTNESLKRLETLQKLGDKIFSSEVTK